MNELFVLIMTLAKRRNVVLSQFFIIINGNRTESEYNSRSIRASNFKSAEHVAQGRFVITSTNTPELFDTKSYY